MGELAAIGLVLTARMAGDRDRSMRLRVIAAAASAPLGMGLYLSFSRGALFAAAAGMVTLIVAAPRWEQLRGGLVAMGAAALGAIAAAPFHPVTALVGSLGTRERDGGIVLGLLAIVTAAAAFVQWITTRREKTGDLRLPRRAPLIALVVICAGLAVVLAVGAKEKSTRPLSLGATRLATLQSSRYAYWRVAIRAFRDEPLRGVGAGGWAVYWLRLRPVNEFTTDAHSLPIQTLAELGIVGLALLAAFLAGIGWAAVEAHGAAPTLAVGPIAGFVVWVAHAPLDWDWQLPALTLVALVLAGALLALAERRTHAEPEVATERIRALRRSAALRA
jgi:O-antigen ligase